MIVIGADSHKRTHTGWRSTRSAADWQVHDNLCSSDPDSGMITGFHSRGGQCPRGQVRWAAPPMLHTWVIDLPGGPFVHNVGPRAVFACCTPAHAHPLGDSE